MGFYRYYYAKKNAYLLCKLIDSDLVSLEDKKEILKDLKWYFTMASDIKVLIANENLLPIFKDIRDEKYDDAVAQMEEVKKVRMTYSVFEKSRMSFPSREDYLKMSKYDNEFINKK